MDNPWSPSCLLGSRRRVLCVLSGWVVGRGAAFFLGLSRGASRARGVSDSLAELENKCRLAAENGDHCGEPSLAVIDRQALFHLALRASPKKSRFPLLTPLARAAALALALLAAPELYSQTTYYWDNNGSTAGFGTAGGTWAAPTTNNSTQGWSTSSAGTNVISGTTNTTTADALNFGTATDGLAAGTITVSGNVSAAGITIGNATGNITLTGGSITLNGTLSRIGSATTTQTINSDIVLVGARQFGANQQNERIILGGNISGSGASLAVDVNATGGLITLNGTNSFTGNLSIVRGQLNVNTVSDKLANSSLGAGSKITIGAGGVQQPALNYTSSSNGSTNRDIELNSSGGGGAIIISQNAALTLSGTVTNTVANSEGILFLSGDAGGGSNINNVSGSIRDNGNSTMSVQLDARAPIGGATEQGLWKLSGNNTYSGNTTVTNAGTLIVSHSNALGTTANGTNVLINGQLLLEGGISVGAEALTLNSAAGASWNSQTGAALRSYSGNNSWAGAITLGQATTIATNSGADLTLSGGISGANNLTFNSIGNTTTSGNISTGAGTLTKSGAGTLTISGVANSWNGTTSISNGTVTLSGNLTTAGSVAINGAAGPVLNITGNLTQTVGGVRNFQIAASAGTTATVNVSGSGILTLGGGMMIGENNGGNGTMNVSGGTVTTNGEIWWAGRNSTLNVSGGTFNATSTTRLGGGSGTTTSTLTVSGSGTYRAGSIDFGIGGSGASTIINLGDGTAGGNLSITAMGYTNGASHTINFNGGTLNVRSSTSMITTNTTTVVKSGGAIIDVNSGQTFTISNNLTTDGTGGGLTKNGTGTLTLSGAGNNYTGTTTVNAGTLTLGANQNLGAIAGAGALNLSTYTLTTNASSDTTYSGVISGTGALTKNGTGTLTLTGNNTYSGATTINAGTLQISSNGLLGGGTYSGNISNSGTFLFDSNSNQTIAGRLSGAGALTKNGTGILTANMTGGSMGQITVNGGTLRLNNTAALNGSTYILTLNSPTTINNGSKLEFDASSTEGRVKFAGGVTFGASGNNTLAMDTFNGTGGSALIQGSYTFTTLGGTTNYITTNAGAYFNMQGTLGRYAIFDVADGTDATDLAVSMAVVDGGIRKSGAGVLTLSASNTGINNLDITNGTLELAGVGSLNSGTFSVDITNNGTLHYNGSNAQTLSGNISGTGALTKSNTSTLTLSGNNTYQGATTINAGTLELSGNISSSALTLNSGGVLSAGSAGTVAISNAASLTISGDSGYAFTIGNISGGTAGTAGIDYDQITTTGAITFNNTLANPLTVYINGTPTNWSSSGSYTWNILSGSSISGFSAGNFIADTSGFGSSVDAAASWTFGTSGGNLTLTYGATGTPTWAGGTGVWSGNFTPGISNNAGMLFTGAGGTATNDIASGTFSSVGTITFNSTAGSYTLVANSGSAGNGSALNVTGSIVNNSANAQTINNALAFTGVRTINTASGNITLGGAISGAGGISKNGSSTLALSGNNTYSGNTTISAGTLQIGGAGLLGGGNYSNTISNSGTLLYTSTANQTLSGVISGAGALTQNAASTLSLTGNNTYSGATTISAGTLAIAAAGRLGGGTYAGNISNNGSLIHAGTNNQTLSGIISGTGALTQNAASTLTLSGNNTYSGATTINAGTLMIGAAGRLGAGNYAGNITNSGAFINTATNNQTLSGILSGTGSLTQNAASTLTLSGSNTYSGGTTISVGTITVTNPTGLGTGSVTAAANTKLSLAPSSGSMTVANAMTLAGGGGILDVSGTVTTSGLITLTGGSDFRSGPGTGVLIVNGGITSANNSALALNFATTINSTISIGTGEITVTGYTTQFNTAGHTYGGTILNYGGNVTLGANNALPSNSKVKFGWNAAGTSTGTLNLNGYNLTVASLEGTLGNYDTQNQNITGGGVLTVNQTAAQGFSYGGRITDGATATSLTKNGSGTLMLQNWSGINSTYTGATTINAGTLMILAGNGTSLSSSSAYTVASGAVLSVNGTSQGLGSLAGSGTVQNGHASTATTLTIGGDNSNSTFSGTIQNGGAAALAITKSGTGTLTLAGTNNHTGATTVSAGTLQLSSNITSSALTLGTGGTISIGNTTASAKYNAASITVQGGSGYAFTIGNVNASVAGTDYDQLTATGALTLSNTAASPFTIYLNGTPTGWSNSGTYSWNLISAASLTGFNSGNFAVNFSNFGIASSNRTGTWTFTNPSGGNLTLTYAAATPDYIWSGTTGDWSTGFTPTAPTTDKNLIFTGSGGTATNDIASGTLSSLNFITFNSTAGAYTLAANAGSAGASGGTALTVKGDIINNSASTQTINLDMAIGGSSSGVFEAAAGNITIGGVISGTGLLTKTGNNTLTLSASNTYTGGTTITGGTLALGASDRIADSGTFTVASGGTFNLAGFNETLNTISGAGNITLGAGTLTTNTTTSNTFVGIISGTGGLTKNGSATLTLTGNNTYSGTTTINAGTLEISTTGRLGGGNYTGNIVNAGTLLLAGTNNQTLGGVISGAGALTKNGTTTVTLSGNNTYTGATTINAGTLEIGASGRLGGGNFTYNITNNGTFLYSGTNNQTLGGVISGVGALTKNGSGTLILSGLNTYSGGTNINAGTLDLRAAATNAYNTGNNTFNINNGSTLLLNTGAAGNPLAQGMVVNFDSNGGGTLTVGSGLNFLLQNTGFFINTNGGAQNLLSSAGGNINDQGTATAVIFNVASGSNATADLLVTGGLSSRNGLTKNGTGKLLFFNTGVGANVGIFDIRINQGTMEFGGTSTLNQYSGRAFTNNGTLSWNSTANLTIANAITGTGNLIKSNTSTLTLSNSTTNYTGLTTINAGTLAIGNNMTIGALAGTGGNLSLGSGFTLTTNASTDTTLSSVVQGSGNLAKSGTGTLTMNGSNTYTGITTINAGTIQIGHANALGTTANITFSGGGLQYGTGITQDLSGRIKNSSSAILVDTNGNNVTFASVLDSTNSGGLTKNGSGTLTLSANNTYTGTTTINTGTLQISSTGLLGGGNYSGNIANSGTVIFGSNSNQTLGGVISGSGALTKNGSGTLTLTGSNNYSGNTTINTGTVVIGHVNAAGTGKIFQTDGTSLLKIDTTGTITNDMSVYNVLASQSATLSGAITVNNATWDIDTGDTLTISGVVSGNGGVTKTGGGTLVLSGNNTYLAPTVINAGTLNAANAGALGANNTVQVNGGTLLVSADDAINGKNIELGGSGVGLRFSGNYSGAIGTLTLSANSIIDLGPDSVRIMIQGLTLSSHTLSFYNWSGLTHSQGGTGADQDKVFLFPTIDPADLNKISFYSGNGGDSFLGTGFDLGLEATGFTPAWGYQIIPVPEPETWATGILLVLGSGVWLWRKRSGLTTEFTENAEEG